MHITISAAEELYREGLWVCGAGGAAEGAENEQRAPAPK